MSKLGLSLVSPNPGKGLVYSSMIYFHASAGVLVCCMIFIHDAFNSHKLNMDLIHCLFSFCLQSVWMQNYRETVSPPDSIPEFEPFTPERTGPQWK